MSSTHDTRTWDLDPALVNFALHFLCCDGREYGHVYCRKCDAPIALTCKTCKKWVLTIDPNHGIDPLNYDRNDVE